MANFFIVLNEFEADERKDQIDHVVSLRRNLRDNENPFEDITDVAFIQLYRLNKQLCLNLINELAPFLKIGRTSHSIPCFIKVLAALRFYATGSFQRSVGQDVLSCLSQTSISRCVAEVTAALNKISHNHVKFPKSEEFAAIKANFYAKHGFPGVIGLIDGTHIKIAAPPRAVEHIYVCRKGGYSKNVQIICDADYLVLGTSARFGGTAHDSYIWRSSQHFRFLRNMYDSGTRNFWLLGDSGYPLQPWLMTPFPNTSNRSQERYNASHKNTRWGVERCIGILKQRFRCLSKERTLFYHPTKVTYIIHACVVLHNILIRARAPLEEFLEGTLDDLPAAETDEFSEEFHGNDCLRAGRVQRENIVRHNFNF